MTQIPSNGLKLITVLIPERIFWQAMPGRPTQSIKDILHTPALTLPLKNFEGVPMRYTFNNPNVPSNYLWHRITVDYLVDEQGRITRVVE